MGPPNTDYSPFKKKITAKVSSKSGGETGHELMVVGFPPTMVELYAYTKITLGSIKENFSLAFRKSFDEEEGSTKFPELEENGFIGYYFMRTSKDSNERKNGSDGYARYFMVRCVPDGNPSSSETRQEGLNFLSAFYKHKKSSKYPPPYIRTIDLTHDPPKAMDEYLMDKDIFTLLKNIFEEDVLDSNFSSFFPEIASVLFGGPIYPDEAVVRLGFGKNTASAEEKPTEQNEEEPAENSNACESDENEEKDDSSGNSSKKRSAEPTIKTEKISSPRAKRAKRDTASNNKN